jgi:hypothetical protein
MYKGIQYDHMSNSIDNKLSFPVAKKNDVRDICKQEDISLISVIDFLIHQYELCIDQNIIIAVRDESDEPK